jgi:hypothetical protein
MNKLFQALLIATLLISSAAQAVVVRGTGTAALVGGDLTDPENNGQADANVNYNATFRSSIENGFGGGEYAYNVFDNRVGGGNDKWCCDQSANLWVEANFGTQRYFLTSFTATSSNDTPGRDSDIWNILGSNDGVNYTTIFAYNKNGTSPWGNTRNQVNQYSAGTDFATQTMGYSIFRYQSVSTVSSNHALNELEFFGNKIPEPGMLSLMALAMAGLGLSLRKKQG